MTDERKDQLTAEADGLIEGRNAVIEALRTEASIDKIFIQKGETDKTLGHIASKARAAGIVVVEADRRKLDGMSRTHAHQGVIALAAVREYVSVEDILADAAAKNEKPLIVVCDEISDPHNLGAIIRTAYCAGAHGVIIPKRRSAGLTSVVAKTSAGAVSHMKVARVPNIPSLLKDLKKQGVWVFGTAADGDTAVVAYMSYAGDDAPLTVSVGRYPLGHPEQAAWVQAQISDSAECYVSTIFTGTTLYTGGQVCLAAGESILLMDPASGEVRQLDLSPMSAPLPDGVSHTEDSYLGASVIGSYGDILLVGKALYLEGVWDRYHYVMAAYQDGKLMAMLDQNSADSAQLTLYGPDGKTAGSSPLMTEDYVASGGTALPVEYIGQLFPLQ